VKRVFLGDGPSPLDIGVKWLLQESAGRTGVIVPNDFLLHRLTELLPRKRFTVYREFQGLLALYPSEKRYPRTLERELLLTRILRRDDLRASIESLFPERKAGSSEATLIGVLLEDLALNRLDASAVAEKLESQHQYEAARWREVAAIERAYSAELEKEGFLNISTQPLPQAGGVSLVFFGMLSLAPLSIAVSKSIGKSATALIFEEQSKETAFDEFGQLLSWEEFEVPQARLHFIPSPKDYIAALQSMVLGEGAEIRSNVGIVTFDELEQRFVRQRLIEEGIQLSTEPTNSLLLQILKATAHSVETERLYDLFSLLRVKPICDRALKQFETTAASSQRLLSIIDQYQVDKLQLKWTEAVLAEAPANEFVQEVRDFLSNNLTGRLLSVRSFSDAAAWAISVIDEFVPEFVAEREILTSYLESTIDIELAPREAMYLLQRLLRTKGSPVGADEIPFHSSIDELYFDQTVMQGTLLGPTLGRFPQPIGRGLFLSDGVSKLLDLTISCQSKDQYYLSKLIKSDRLATIIVPQQTLEGEATALSPLLYPIKPEQIAQELDRFFSDLSKEQEEEDEPGSAIFSGLPQVADPLALFRSKQGKLRLSITSLDYYANSPFRFYLERVLRLGQLRDNRKELDGRQFGNAAHLIVGEFAQLTGNEDQEHLLEFIQGRVQRIRREIYGTNISATILTQFKHLEERLRSYAPYELELIRSGWRTQLSEVASRPYEIETSKEPVQLTARVDRIDYNSSINAYRIWDYKTSDSPKKLFKKGGGLKELQLPLYALLFRQGLLVEKVAGGASLEVGYISLASTGLEPKSYPITDEQIREALSLAREVLERFVARDFNISTSERIPVDSDLSIFYDRSSIDFSDEDEGETNE